LIKELPASVRHRPNGIEEHMAAQFVTCHSSRIAVKEPDGLYKSSLKDGSVSKTADSSIGTVRALETLD
jgi:hypothetical protein